MGIDTVADILFTGMLDAAYAAHGVLSLTATGSITDNSSLNLIGANGIDTFKSGDNTYAVIAADRNNSVQILNVTYPTNITATDSITDNATNLELGGAYSIATFKSGGHTYAAVAAFDDDGVQILNVTDPTDITATDSITDNATNLELEGVRGIIIFNSSGHIYAAVAANTDNGVQILNVTDPTTSLPPTASQMTPI